MRSTAAQNIKIAGESAFGRNGKFSNIGICNNVISIILTIFLERF